MPQREFRITAPLNQTPKWPDGYIVVLREAGTQEKTIPYCIGWVRQFFAANPNRQHRDMGRMEIEAFLAQLTRRAGVGNWQVQQARDALELYYERFRGVALAPRPEVPAHLNDPPSTIATGSVSALSHNATPQDGEVQRDYSRSETPVNAFSTRVSDLLAIHPRRPSGSVLAITVNAVVCLPRASGATVQSCGSSGPTVPPAPAQTRHGQGRDGHRRNNSEHPVCPQCPPKRWRADTRCGS